MTRRYLLSGAVILVVSVIGFTVYRSRRPVVTPVPSTSNNVEKKLPGPAKLPDYFERPSVVSKRLGSIRLYVAVTSEIPVEKTDAQSGSVTLLDRVPIRVVLENETYRALTLNEAVNASENLFDVSVSKLESSASREVFIAHQSSSEVIGWEPAERKTFTIDWPLAEPMRGSYVVAVTPGFGDRSTVQIRTTLK